MVANNTQSPSFSDRIKRMRGRLGLTQEALAEQLGVSFATVNRWENKQTRPSRIVLEKVTRMEAEIGSPRKTEKKDKDDTPIHLDFTGNADAVQAIAEGERLGFGHVTNPAFATEISRIDPLPHQRIAVYDKMLKQDRLRFLLADDAGAGKTIMTGLYLREMLSRRIIRRVLIVPPAGLVGNWQSEMKKLFSLGFKVVSGSDAVKSNPFAGEGSDRVIVSVDTLRSKRVYNRLSEDSTEPYDLVVFDEAHKLSANQEADFRIKKTSRYELAEALAGVRDRSEHWALHWSANHLLLLTATPHMGKDYPYYALWRLLMPDQLTTMEAFNSFTKEQRESHFIRRTKEEMVFLDGRPLYPKRISDTLGFDLTSGEISEQSLYDKTTNYLKFVYNKAKILNRSAARLAMSVFQRRLASSTYALLQSFERRLEKINHLIEEVQQGSISVEEMNRLQQKRLREDADVFESKTAEEEIEGENEENEDNELELLGYFVAASLRDLLTERNEVRELRDLARAVYEKGVESKFERLQEIIEAPAHQNEKLIIFTEHKDTLNYLIRRLNGLGYTGKIAQIHGGMHYTERAVEVERFRKENDDGGARFMVCTDAAAEGINLQFCWVMINYDIPWNPARLEQRMGRIHRYGQQHDPVVILNLVAPKTREGRVLKTLLDKLEAIRRQLNSDKVFDVIGRLFEGVSIRDYMASTIEHGGADSEVQEIEGKLTTEQTEALLTKEATLYGMGGDVKPLLPDMRAAMDRETYFKLLPGYVRSYFEKAAPLAGIWIENHPNSLFRLKPDKTQRDTLLNKMTWDASHADQLFSFNKPTSGESVVWLHPGEPVLENFLRVFEERYSKHTQRGAVFIDPDANTPYLFHLAKVTIIRKADPDTPELNHGETIECRLVGLKQYEGAEIEICPLEHLLLLRGTHGIPKAAQLLASDAHALRDQARAYLMERNARELALAHKRKLQESLETRVATIERGFAYQTAELAKARAKLSKKAREGNKSAQIELDKVKKSQRTRTERLSRALQVVEREPALIQAAPIEFITHALVIPSTDPLDLEQRDANVEQVAMNLAWAYEESSGAIVKDVHTPALARAVGLSDNPGFDLLAVYPDGEERCIEVKGRARTGAVEVSRNEWAKACNLGDRYWLYVVYGCATHAPQMERVRDPFLNLITKAKGSTLIDPKAVREAAETEVNR